MRRLASFVMMMLFANIVVLGQVTGSLSGSVKDPVGAAIVGADVTVKNIATAEEFHGTTNDQGSFVFPQLPPGRYAVSVQAEGFKRTEVTDVQIEVSQPAKVAISLEIGEVSEQVTVSSGAQEVINTVSPVLSATINIRQVKDLPLPSRNPLDLARLQPGIAVQGDATRNAEVGGLRGTATTVTQDGVNAMDNFVKTSSFFAISAPSVNATSEFSITTGTVGSDAGRGVAQVRLVTTGGTNDLHGSLFYQHRNDALNANDFFNNFNDLEREIERQHFFGFTAGGPVWIPKVYDGRNSSFWFFSYEGFREPFSVTRNRAVLTEEARRGIFRYTGSNGQLQTVNLLAIGNANSINPLTSSLIEQTPLPNNSLLGDGFNTGGFTFNVPGVSNNDKISIRADQKLFDKLGSHKLEWVFHRAWFLLTPDTFNGLEARFPGRTDNASQRSTRTLTAAAIHSTFGARATNEFRAGYQRAPVGFLRDSPPEAPFFTNFPGDITDVELTFMSQGRNTQLFQFVDNFSLVKGTHNFKMGTDIQSVTATTFNDAGIQQVVNLGSNSANPNGILNSEFPLLPAGSAGTTLANRARGIFHSITGLLASAQQTFNVASPTSGFVPGATRARNFQYRDVSFYFQDQWRMKRNFTLNYGLRWEFLGVTKVTNGLAIQPTTRIAGLFGISGQGNLFQPGVLNGEPETFLDFVSGDTGIPLHGNDWNNFAPFIGFAYSPAFDSGPIRWLFGPEGMSSIRAGFAITYLRDGFTVVSNALGTGTTNPGLIQTAANTTPTGVLQGTFNLPAPQFRIPISDRQNNLANTNNGLWTFDPNLRTPYVQQWSFGIERQIGANAAMEVRYVGNHALKIFRAFDFNEVNIIENGFLQEFLNARKNLAASGGTSFAPGPFPLPILSTLFQGLSQSSGFRNSTFINQLNLGNAGAMASTLAFSNTYRGNRANLVPNFFVANPNAAFARLLTNGGFSSYHSLQVLFRRRLSRGFSWEANYTLSKAITNSEGSQSTLESARTLRNLDLDRHQADFDQTHRFIANAIYELPIGPGRRFLSGAPGPLGKLLEGWEVGSIVNWQTGPPFGIFSGRSTFNNFNSGLNPAALLGMSFDDFRRNIGVFRTAGGVFFVNPSLLDFEFNAEGQVTNSTLKEGLLGPADLGSFGNFPRNVLRSPRFFKADFSLIKRTRFAERGSIEFRTTLLNAFNNANFVFGDQNFDSSSFGQITSTRSTPRIIHFLVEVRF